MHTISHEAERQLHQRIEGDKTALPNMRCVYIRDLAPEIEITKIIDVLRDEMIGMNSTCYVCEDRDVYLLDAGLSIRLLQKIIDRIAKDLSVDLGGDKTSLYEVGFDWEKIQKTLTTKIEIIDERRRTAAKTQQEKKRQEVLGMAVDPALLSGIAAKRRAHKTIQVLVVEDDVFTHRLITKTIGDQAQVQFCTDAAQAISTYAIAAPHIVFLDIGLPDVSGHDVVTKILQLDPQAWIVMLSGNSDMSNVKQALSNGAKGFVVKPFTKAKIWEYINRCPKSIV